VAIAGGLAGDEEDAPARRRHAARYDGQRGALPQRAAHVLGDLERREPLLPGREVEPAPRLGRARDRAREGLELEDERLRGGIGATSARRSSRSVQSGSTAGGAATAPAAWAAWCA
jgi:hypothetical protein